jgi:hypothetical protein
LNVSWSWVQDLDVVILRALALAIDEGGLAATGIDVQRPKHFAGIMIFNNW